MKKLVTMTLVAGALTASLALALVSAIGNSSDATAGIGTSPSRRDTAGLGTSPSRQIAGLGTSPSGPRGG
jgi:hypothetical protein